MRSKKKHLLYSKELVWAEKAQELSKRAFRWTKQRVAIVRALLYAPGDPAI